MTGVAVDQPPVERLSDADAASPLFSEHRSRYQFASQYVRGRSVVDVACGDGWGGAMLIAAGATSVLGIDSAPDAVRAARRHLVPGYRVELGDATDLQIPDASVDVVVSFETLEHLVEPARFLAGARRILRATGILVLSTPNANHTKPGHGVPHNPFHIHEYTPGELAAMLSRWFSSVELMAQRVHPRFRPCPYWERPEVRTATWSDRARSIRWQLLARLPPANRDRLAQSILGHQLLPGPDDFVFDQSDPNAGHVLLAVCRAS